jgi:hypothetical protein
MRITSLFLLFFLSASLIAQEDKKAPEFQLTASDIRAQMEFLASDFLEGRRTGSKGNTIAAEYIAAHLKAYGYQPPVGMDDYFQRIPFESINPPFSSSMTINGKELKAGEDFLVISGPALSTKTKGVFAGHGWVDEETKHDDYANLDIEGKVVFVLPGPPGARDPMSIVSAMSTKRALAEARGAIALIELYQLPFPWEMFTGFFGGESLSISKTEDKQAGNITYGWLNKSEAISFTDLQTAKKLKVSLSSSGFSRKMVYSQNVVGVIEGSDPNLKNEYLLISAHYDHVGVGSQGGQYTEQDSIFNGARDNAFGTIAMLNAAKALALQPPARSIIVVAFTGEELGLLGSSYYAENPPIPLEEVIFNFNTDGAGYSVTDAVSIFGWSRTGTNEMLEAGVAPFNLRIIGDPAPEQGLFDRSDNVSFARRGVPALTFSPGFEEFDAAILEHYHQVSDEADSIDYSYFLKYCQAFAHCTRMIANDAKRPEWVEGDKYEEAGKALYEKE